ncbi:alpha/beta fold hydrolase [Geodermatophilus sp. SYSU D00815]
MLDAHERFVASGPLRIWTERVGDPGLPAVLMVMGSAAQAVLCPDALVGRLVERGVQVIRFDHRDTGRSSVVDFDAHPYTIGDMARDCLAVLDGHGLGAAHVAGTSLGGMIAQWLGVHAPDRVRSLTVISSSPMGHDPRPAWARALAGEPADPDDLPPPSPAFLAHQAAGLPPGVESDVALFRVFNGPVRPFDEPAARSMLELALSRPPTPGQRPTTPGPCGWTPLTCSPRCRRSPRRPRSCTAIRTRSTRSTTAGPWLPRSRARYCTSCPGWATS